MRRLALVLLVLAAVGLLAWLTLRDDSADDVPERPDEMSDLWVERHTIPRFGSTRDTPATRARLTFGRFVIAGRVYRNGAPAIADVNLFLLHEHVVRDHRPMQPPREAGVIAWYSCASDGRFEFRGVGQGAYRLVARAEDGARAKADVRCWQSPPIVRLELESAAAVLAGRAVYEDGSPFEGIAFLGDGQDGTTGTYAGGWFQFRELTPGKYWLTLLEPGLLRVRLQVEVPREEDLLVVVDGGAKPVTGRVVAADDESPVAGAHVMLTGGNLQAGAQTDVDGAFSIRVPGDEINVQVVSEGFGPISRDLPAEPGMVLRLLRVGSVTGRVVREDGTPVPGVPVVGDPRHSRMPLARAVSAEDGTFVLPPFGVGRASAYALGKGWVSEGVVKRRSWQVDPTQVEIPAGGTLEVVLTVVPASRLAGRVVDARGAPLSEITVAVETSRTWYGIRRTATKVTDANGAFAFEDLVPTYPYDVVAVPSEGMPVTRGVPGLDPGETGEMEIIIPDPRCVVLEVVEAGTGTPIVMAGVTVRQDRASAHFQTGVDGTAKLGPLHPGPATVRVDHGAYLSPRRPLPVPEDEDRFRVELDPALFIAGKVVQSDGSPAEGLRVWIVDGGALAREWATRTSGYTEEDGSFRLGPLPEGEHELGVSAGFRSTLAKRRVRAGEEELLIEVDPPPEPRGEEPPDHGEFVVRWHGPDGRPAVGGYSLLEGDGHPATHSRTFSGSTRYRIIEPGAQVRIEVCSAQDAKGRPLGAVRVGPLKLEPKTIDVGLPEAKSIEGRVLDPDGEGVAGVLVKAESEATRTRHGSDRTGSEGRFALPGLGDMSYTVSVLAPFGFVEPDPIAAKGGATGVEFRLVKAGVLTVRVLGPDGKPFPHHARVTAVRLPDRGRSHMEIALDDGEAFFDRLDPAREYDLRIAGAEGGLAWSTSRVRPGAEPVVARLAPGLAITGKLELPPGANRFEVYATLEGSAAMGVVEKDGSFRLAGLTEGVWTVNAAVASQNKAWYGTAQVAAGTEATIKLSSE